MSKSYFIDFIIPFFDTGLRILYMVLKPFHCTKIEPVTGSIDSKLNKQTSLTLDSKDRIREIWSSNGIRLLENGTPTTTLDQEYFVRGPPIISVKTSIYGGVFLIIPPPFTMQRITRVFISFRKNNPNYWYWLYR
jgi:hypothetical protein